MIQTDRKPDPPAAPVEAECISCAHAFTIEEIETQLATLLSAEIHATVAKYQGGKSDESM